jgi:N-acetylmuramoyl-L-alanine amidase
VVKVAEPRYRIVKSHHNKAMPSTRILTTLLIGLLIAGDALAAGVTLSGVRLSAAPSGTRVVLDLSSPASHALFTLQDPDRVVVDVRDARLDSARLKVPEGRGAVRRVRVANRDNGDARVVLDLVNAAQVRSFLVPPDGPWGHRLVIDLPGSERPAAVVRATPGGAGRDLIIAIDAGHGGKDPGATGRSGVREKDIVLQIARRLAKRIDQEPGMRAFLVRDGDYFLSLHQRVSRARMERADLFVSIHADAFRNRDARGSSVYILSARRASSEAARWLAEKENAADLVGGVSLDDKDDMLASVLLDLSQSAAIDASQNVGDAVLQELRRVGRVHKTDVQRASFKVLTSPDIPSILVETAFISNPSEEKLLRTSAHQEALAAALMNGVRRYFEVNAPPGTLLASRGAAGEFGPVEHVIVRGDTLSDIADRYNVSTRTLRRYNGLKSDRIRIGQVLRIPGSTGG